MRWPGGKHKDLDDRLERASEQLEMSGRQVELSRQRLAWVRRDVVRPIAQAGVRNQFASIIEASLGLRRGQADGD